MPLREVDPEETCALALVADPLVWITQHLRERVHVFQTTATALSFAESAVDESKRSNKKSSPKMWSSPSARFPRSFPILHLDEIPVEVALDPEKLAEQPLDGATVAVFGSSHSSMIVLPQSAAPSRQTR